MQLDLFNQRPHPPLLTLLSTTWPDPSGHAIWPSSSSDHRGCETVAIVFLKRFSVLFQFHTRVNTFLSFPHYPHCKWETDWCTVIQTLCSPLYFYSSHSHIMFSLGNIWDGVLTIWRCVQLKYKDHTMLPKHNMTLEWGRGAPGQALYKKKNTQASFGFFFCSNLRE